MEANFIGKEALKKIKQDGIKRKQVGLELDCEPLQGPNTTFWPIKKDNTTNWKNKFCSLFTKT